MIRIFLLLSLIFLSSCNNLGSGKIKEIVYFTETLKADGSLNVNVASYSSPSSSLNSWHNYINAVNEQPKHFTLATSLEKFKSVKLATRSIEVPPVIADNKIFNLDVKNTLSCFDLDSHKLLWKTNIAKTSHKDYLGGGLIYNNGKLIVSAGDRDVAIINAISGKEEFRKTFNDIIRGQVAFHDNKIYALTVTNVLYCVDSKKGDVLWQHEAVPEILSGGRFVSPIVYNNKVFVNYSSGMAFALEASTGKPIWGLNLAGESQDLPEFSTLNVEVQPVIDGNFIYVALNEGHLHKIDINTGNIVWRKPIQDIKAMNISGDVIYIATNAKELAAINKNTGSIGWVTDLKNEKDKKTFTAVTFVTPMIINKKLYQATSEGKLYEINPRDGSIISTTPVVKDVFSFAVLKDRIYLFDKKGSMSFNIN